MPSMKQHFTTRYRSKSGSREMTVHYVLYLADYVLNCGPLLNVCQFPMERLFGETDHALNSTHLVA